MEDIRKRLFELQDFEYKAFHSKLIPDVDPDTVIGVRTPVLRKLAKELEGTEAAKAFIKELPHVYYEENNLHGFLVEGIKDYEACIDALDKFLPYVDNWATCDMIAPKVFKKHLDKLERDIERWLRSERTYMVRFAICMLLKHFLDDRFESRFLDMVVAVKSDEYYINMVRAWYFATALAKQYEKTFPYIKGERLDVWTHNKVIQKARESFRLNQEQKELLKSMKRI